EGTVGQWDASRVSIRDQEPAGPYAVLPAVLRDRSEGGARSGARSTDDGGVVHGRRLQIETRGVPEHPAVRPQEPGEPPAAAARAMVDRRCAESRQAVPPHSV